MTDAIALDASVASAWCFTEETTPYTDAVFSLVVSAGAVAPRVWAYEIRNSVLMGLRRGRVTAGFAQNFLGLINSMRVRLVDPPSFDAVFAIAERHSLTLYDAAYVELAMREGLRLATLDKAMRRAATQVGIVLLDL